MKISNTAERLRQILVERKLRQVDIISMCKPYCERYGVKMNKSDISQYIAGKSEPSQDKLVVLAMALDVQESWLMGFDVPAQKQKPAAPEGDELSNVKAQLMDLVSGLSEAEAAILLASLNSVLGKQQ
jgi:transcriptional regulator with XRE-family HTH domain